MLKYLLLPLSFSFCLFFSHSARAANNLSSQNAEENYQQGKFPEAVRLYIEALKDEPSNASLYHNLALALEKDHKLGAAVAAYLRAVQLQPQDPDFRYNLRFLLDQTEDRLSYDMPTHGIPAVFKSLSERELFYPAWLLFFSGVGLLIWNNLRARRSFALGGLGTVFLLLATVGISGVAAKTLRNPDPGAIGIPKASVYAAPNESLVIFQLHEGAPVQILERNGDWFHIELADQKTGWLKKEAVVLFGGKNQTLPAPSSEPLETSDKS